jgi:hypothetical protein
MATPFIARPTETRQTVQLVAAVIDLRQLVPQRERERAAVIEGQVKHPSFCRFPTRNSHLAASRFV